jgi:hypothetical protein
MAIKTVAALRLKFEGLDAPTQQDWIDLIDTMQGIMDTADLAILTAQPVTLVANQAARLALPPTFLPGQRAKQTDNGLTYVKQQQPGSNLADWTEIGDASIEISDVFDLQNQLDSKLINYDWDITTGDIAAKNYYLANISINNTGPNIVSIPIPGNAFEYAFRDVNFTISLVPYGAPDPIPEGCSSTVAIYNSGAGSIDASLDPGFRVFGQPFPVTIPNGKWLVMTITILPDPGYGGVAPFYFIGYALQG